MKHRVLSVTVAGLGVAATLLVAQVPAAAGPGDPKNKDLRETGCRDVVDKTTARYTRDRVVESPLHSDEDYPDEFQADAGTAEVSLVLAAPSCATVTYTIIVYGADQQVLAQTAVAGDDKSGTVDNPLPLTARVKDYADDCLMIVVTTSVQGIVVDTAPDAVPDYRAICDGKAPALSYK